MNTMIDTYPFKLNKLTLRGIGSYLDGADIDIKPLTILCGTNGSGKSTWVNVVSLLKSATTKVLSGSDEINFNSFFKLCEKIKTGTEDKTGEKKERCINGTIANTRISQAYGDEGVDGLPNSHADEKLHGPIGTAGFYFTINNSNYCQQKKELVFCKNLPSSPLWIFLKEGTISKKTNIKLFITIPDTYDTIEGLSQGFTLVFGEETLTYKKTPKKNPNYDCENTTPNVTRFKDDTRLKISCQNDEIELTTKDTDLKLWSDNSFFRVITLLKDLLNGFYHIEAIRNKFDMDEEQFYSDDADNITKGRHVGFNGEYTHFLANKYRWNLMDSELKYGLGEYYSTWLKELLGHGTCYTGERDNGYDVIDESVPNYPVDFMKSHLPNETAISNKKHIDDNPSKNPNRYARYTSGILWGAGMGFGPSSFSSGFHQVAPMIVQSGLMEKFEINAIENPEVHLHPNLQLKLTEFFLKQANSGRYFIIETHSDLIIRRLIRAILEEEVKFAQQKIGIYFTSIEPSAEYSWQFYSKIKRLEVDEQGRINNWPTGFLDESLKESQRLMKIVYNMNIQRDRLEDDE